MSKAKDKMLVVEEIKNAALLYKQHLLGRQFLYVFDGRYIEVLFKKENFRHLTGVDTNLSAKNFFSLALSRKLSASQIFFSKHHPFDLCIRKIKYLSDISTLATSESIMLEDIHTATRSYKFGTTDLRFSLCVDKEFDTLGNPIGACHVVHSLRAEDCFQRSQKVYNITHIFSRPNDERLYTELCYCDGSAGLPREMHELVADETLAGVLAGNDKT